MPSPKFYRVELFIAVNEDLGEDVLEACDKVATSIRMHINTCKMLVVGQPYVRPFGLPDIALLSPSPTDPETPAPSDRTPDEPEKSG